jgi:HEPN domain-containing protein
MKQKQALDDQGIPILTAPLADRDVVVTDDLQLAERLSGLSTTAIVRALLASEPFRQQLEELAGRLARQVHEEIQSELQPMLEAALEQALEDSNTRAVESIHQHLEASLPGLLARTLRKD